MRNHSWYTKFWVTIHERNEKWVMNYTIHWGNTVYGQEIDRCICCIWCHQIINRQELQKSTKKDSWESMLGISRYNNHLPHGPQVFDHMHKNQNGSILITSSTNSDLMRNLEKACVILQSCFWFVGKELKEISREQPHSVFNCLFTHPCYQIICNIWDQRKQSDIHSLWPCT